MIILLYYFYLELHFRKKLTVAQTCAVDRYSTYYRKLEKKDRNVTKCT